MGPCISYFFMFFIINYIGQTGKRERGKIVDLSRRRRFNGISICKERERGGNIPMPLNLTLGKSSRRMRSECILGE